jgi:transcriptional regulator with XRE-family HTH domain
MNTHDSQTTKHEGKNVKRLREILGVKQETLAAELGINQQKMSFWEQKEKIDEDLMEQIAKALKVPIEAIRNFNEEAAVNIISNNSFENCDQPASIFYYSTINPVDKWVEALKKNEDLYERLLQSEREKVALLEKLVQGRQ